MYRGLKGDETFPYILRGDRESESPTIWMLRPQKVRKGNRNLAGYFRAQSKQTDDAAAEAVTKQDLNQFISVLESVRNYCFADDDQPREKIEDPSDLKRVFFELDYNSVSELMNASRDIFALRESEKKGSSSSSGAGSNASTPAGSDMTANDAPSRDSTTFRTAS